MATDLDTIAMLRDSAARYAEKNYSFHQRWAVLDESEGFSRKAWSDFAELGLLALRLPEDDGGLDADGVAIGAVMEIVGARLLMEPFFASAVIATGLMLRLAPAPLREQLLPALAAGDSIVVLADEEVSGSPCVLSGGRFSGSKVNVLHGDVADRVLVSARDDRGVEVVVLVDPAAAGVVRRSYRLVDGRGAAAFDFADVAAEPLCPESGLAAGVALAAAREEAAVALCAESLGIVCSLVQITNEYLKMRKQFGKPIGANQALQHRMVDCFLLQEEVKALTAAGQQALSIADGAQRSETVSGARAYVMHAARRIGNEAVQMHGGLGVTDELDVSHYFRRLMVNAALFGGHDAHFERFAASALAA